MDHTGTSRGRMRGIAGCLSQSFLRGFILLSPAISLMLALFPSEARSEYSQELSLHLFTRSSNGYHLVDNEKKPLTEAQHQVDLAYGYFLNENIQMMLRFSLDDTRIVADESKYHILDQRAAVGFLLNLPDGAKGYAIATSKFIPYLGLFYGHKLYPKQEELYLLANGATGLEFMVGVRYFIFQRIAWNMWARASTFSQPIQTDEADEATKGYREGTQIEVQLFGLSFLW